MQKKKGISLIVLVITIIVMIVLAGAIILSLNNAGIIGKSNEAVSASDYNSVRTAAQLVYADIILGKSTGGLWAGEYIKKQLIEDGVINAEQATMYRFKNNGEVIKLQTESEYNEIYKDELAKLDKTYYEITQDGVFNLTEAGKTAVINGDITVLAIPYGVKAIGSVQPINSHNYSDTKVTKLIMPDTVENIQGSFSLYKNLSEIVLSKNIKKESWNFWNTAWLKNKIEEAKNGNKMVIEHGVLFDASNAKGNVVIPDEVEIIAQWAFNEGEEVTSVIFPSTVSLIGDYAFCCEYSLTNIEFKGIIPEIGFGAFGAITTLSDSIMQKLLQKNPDAFNDEL